MSSVQDFRLTFNVLNNNNGTVSQGDTLAGTISLTLKRQTKVKSLLVKATGDARVCWTSGSGDHKTSHRAHRRYFMAQKYVIGENSKDNVLPQGMHRLRFELKIPQGNLPSSFRGSHGTIAYVLTAKMSGSWQFPRAVQQEFCFVSKSSLNTYDQVGPVEKEVGVLSKGQVHMAVTVDRRVYNPGETVSAVAKITNSSSKQICPKFSLEQQIVYRADGSPNICWKSVCKVVGVTIAQQKKDTVSCGIKIPNGLNQTVHNCDIISVAYYLKVYSDTSAAVNPQVHFPIVITLGGFTNCHLGVDVAPHTAGAFGGPSNTDFPPSYASGGPYPELSRSGGCPTPDPAQHANMHQLPQHTTPYGASYSDFPSSSSSAHWPLPPAPPVDEHEEPPSYESLFPVSDDYFRG